MSESLGACAFRQMGAMLSGETKTVEERDAFTCLSVLAFSISFRILSFLIKRIDTAVKILVGGL